MRNRAWLWFLLIGLVPTALHVRFPRIGGTAPFFHLVGIAAIVAILVGVRVHRPANRRPWYLLAAGQGVFVLGDLVAYNYDRLFGHALPFPSIADALYLLVYPLLIIGLVLVIRARRVDIDRTSLLDSVILAVGIGMVSWTFLISPYAHDRTLPVALKLISAGYPVMDLLLMAMIVRLAFGPGRRTAAFWLLVGGAGTLLVTDGIFGWLILHTNYQTGGPLDIGWALFYLLLGAAALHPSMRELATPQHVEERAERPGRLVMLAGAALLLPLTQIILAVTDTGRDEILFEVVSGSLFVMILLRVRRLMVDVHEHRKTESALRTAESRYRALVEGVPAVVYRLEMTPTVRWVYVSPRSVEVFGYTPEQWYSDPQLWHRSVGQEDVSNQFDENGPALAAGNRVVAEYRFRRADGEIRWIRDETQLDMTASSSPVLQGVMFDVTDQKLAELRLVDALNREREATAVLRRLDETKNSILTAVSHELRTPLTSILGMSSILREHRGEVPQARVEEFVDRIGVNAERLSRLLTDLLDLDRLSRGILEPNRQPMELPQAVGALLEETRTDGRSLLIHVDPVVADLDPSHFERIVVNLVMNAVRYTLADSLIELDVRARAGGILITVLDRGPGVPDELKDTIFEPFQRGTQVIEHSPGVGVGLSLVHRFAELHGGQSWVEDRPGGGAVFQVWLPSERIRAMPTAQVDVVLDTPAAVPVGRVAVPV